MSKVIIWEGSTIMRAMGRHLDMAGVQRGTDGPGIPARRNAAGIGECSRDSPLLT